MYSTAPDAIVSAVPQDTDGGDSEVAGQLSLEAVAPGVFPARLNSGGVGWTAPQVCQIAGITYRQLDYWARTQLARPSLQQASGSGTKRLYSYRDIIVVKSIARFLATGLSLQNIRTVVARLATLGVEDMSAATLFSDGVSVYLAYSADDIVDLLRDGHGVFAIALRPVVADTAAQIVALPGLALHDAAAGPGVLRGIRNTAAG